jgi:hypothetical protein
VSDSLTDITHITGLGIVGVRDTYKPKQAHDPKAEGETSTTSEKEKESTEEDKEGRNEGLRSRKAGSARVRVMFTYPSLSTIS